jgi:hypothetical protein
MMPGNSKATLAGGDAEPVGASPAKKKKKKKKKQQAGGNMSGPAEGSQSKLSPFSDGGASNRSQAVLAEIVRRRTMSRSRLALVENAGDNGS